MLRVELPDRFNIVDEEDEKYDDYDDYEENDIFRNSPPRGIDLYKASLQEYFSEPIGDALQPSVGIWGRTGSLNDEDERMKPFGFRDIVKGTDVDNANDTAASLDEPGPHRAKKIKTRPPPMNVSNINNYDSGEMLDNGALKDYRSPRPPQFANSPKVLSFSGVCIILPDANVVETDSDNDPKKNLNQTFNVVAKTHDDEVVQHLDCFGRKISPGCIVTRGTHWQYGDEEDGGRSDQRSRIKLLVAICSNH